MLRRILILALILPLALWVSAQHDFKPSTHFGFHGGMNFSAVAFNPKNPDVKQGLLTSSAFGLILRHVSEPHIGMQLEVNVAGKGWKETIDSIGTYTRRLETLDIPLTAVFIAGSRTLRLAFTIGPYVSYRRHDKETISIADTVNYRAHYMKPLVDKWEFGFTGGISIEFHTKIGAFCTRASYSHGLNNLFPLDVKEYYFTGSRNQVIYAGLCYIIKL